MVTFVFASISQPSSWFISNRISHKPVKDHMGKLMALCIMVVLHRKIIQFEEPL